MALYKEAFGNDPVQNQIKSPHLKIIFLLIAQPTVPDAVKMLACDPQKLAQEMVEACEEYGLRLHGPGRSYPPAGVCHRCGRRLCSSW